MASSFDTTLSNLGIARTTSATAAKTTTAAAAGTLNQSDFLKLMTAQMQNQDPLDPMDTSEYTNQLVQFSQVEQTIQQTGTLRDILSRLSTQDMAQASGFIGREAQFASPVSGLSADAPATWGYSSARPAASLTRYVRFD